MNFHKIFESLEHKRDDAHLILFGEENSPIVVNESWIQHGTLDSFFAKAPHTVQEQKTKDNERSLKIFQNLVKSETAHLPPEKARQILQKVKAIKQRNEWLTAGKVRTIYKQIIAAQLFGIRKIAALSRDDDRIVLDGCKYKVQNVYLANCRQATRQENRRTVQEYYNSLVAEWGTKRVHRAMARHAIDLCSMINKGEAIRAYQVNRITLGLAEFYEEDLVDCWERIQKVCTKKMSFSECPARDREKIVKLLHLQQNTPAAVTEKLIETFKNCLEDTFETLPSCLQQFMKDVTLPTSAEIDLLMQGKRIEGIIGGNAPTVYSDFFHSYDIVDRERLQLYQKILNAETCISQESMELFFDEILAKGVVKKEMRAGMLVPTPFPDPASTPEHPISRHYVVKDRVMTGRSKFAYYLEGRDLKDYLLYRSTSSSPSALDSFTGVLTDLNPFAPPGYLWKRNGEKQERALLFKNSNKTIRIVGHSLGGIQAQLLLMHQIKKQRKILSDLPNRDIEIITFDSPMLRLRCAGAFAYWLDQPENFPKAKRISIEHYIGDRDPAHRIGDVPLGWGADRARLKKYVFKKTTPRNLAHPEMMLHPHNRRYFSTRPGIDFQEFDLNVDNYHTQAWDVIEVIRRIVGIIFYPFIYIFGFLKRFLFGWRGGQSGITKLFHKALPPSPLEGTE